MATPFKDEALRAQIKRVRDLVPALALDPSDIGVLISEAANGFQQVMEERDQARKSLAELHTLVMRTAATQELRSKRQVRAERREAEYFEAMKNLAVSQEKVNAATQLMMASQISAEPVSHLSVGAITQREADLIELSMMWLTDSEDFQAARLAFQQAMQPAPEDSR